MWLTQSCLLAQQNPDLQDATIGQVLSGTLVLLLMGLSLGMIIVWGLRYQKDGHVLPAAGRGLLRVPPALTLVGLVMAVLILLLVLANSLVPADGLATERAGAETADAADTDSTQGQAFSPEQMKSALVQTLVFDVALLLVFGLVVASVSHQGRVPVPAVDGLQRSLLFGPRTIPSVAAAFPRSDPWPDLDAAVAQPPLTSLPTANAPDLLPMAAGPGASIEHPLSAGEPDACTPVAASEPVAVHESFRFFEELRWAAEVFVASYLPTTMLRLIIMGVLLVLTGKEPESHPFLEMIGEGTGWEFLLMIGIMAVIMAPLVEELFYRVVILGGFVQLHRQRTGLVVSSVVFCFAHGFPDSLALFPLALALGYTYIRRRSYITAMLVHFLFNGFNLLVAGLAMLS